MNQTESTHQFTSRKSEHIHFALQEDAEALEVASLNQITLIHDSLPELDFSEVSIESSLFDQPIATPYFIAGMTGGHSDAQQINLTLASVAAKRGWILGIGSQRREIESDFIDSSSILTTQFPQLKLIANLGIAQLITLHQNQNFKKLNSVIERLNPIAIAIHLNPLQEAIQKEGTPNFKGAIQALRFLISNSNVPVVIKETGSGMSEVTLQKIEDKPFAVDVSGLGGTHWGRIEGKRAAQGTVSSELGKTFSNWGTPTCESVQMASRMITTPTEIWASGGVRSGLDAAKLFALGAKRVGFAKPALQAALAGQECLEQWMQAREEELRLALFCTGSAKLSELNHSKTKIKIGI